MERLPDVSWARGLPQDCQSILDVSDRRRVFNIQPGRRGPRPLAAMALDILAQNPALLGPEHVAALHGGQRDALRDSLLWWNKQPFAQWKLLLPPAAERTCQFFAAESQKIQAPLSAYTAALTAPTLAFVAHLRITSSSFRFCRAAELMPLATMPNLGVLEIFELDPELWGAPVTWEEDDAEGGGHDASDGADVRVCQVSDRLVRGWSETRPAAFPALRVLRLWGCRRDMLTPACLAYAARLPRLAHLDISLGTGPTAGSVDAGGRPGWQEAATASAWTAVVLKGEYCLQHVLKDAGESKDKDEHFHFNSLATHTCSGRRLAGAQRWGANLYSFLAAEGYTDAAVANLPFVRRADRADRAEHGPLRDHFALLSLGDTRPHILRDGRGLQRAMCFVRTREALAVARRQAKEDAAPSSVPGKRPLAADLQEGGAARRLRITKRRTQKSIGRMLEDFR